MSNKISKRIRFKDRPDWINGRYFIFTLPYSIFYIVGAILGYSKTKNLFCLCFSGFCGILFLLLSIGHIIDYYRGVSIESFYVAIPLSVSLFVSIFMTCVWSLGSTFKSSGIVAFTAWAAVVVYFYAMVKDYSGGALYRKNNWYQQINKHGRRQETFSAYGDSILTINPVADTSVL